jgi:YVTN family beta-propeller protein
MPSGTKAYVCDWFTNEVAVLDLNSGSVIKHIPAGSGPEQSTISGSKLFVANVGGLTSDSTITVIDMFADTVVATLQVGVNPNSIVTDKYGKIWVLCGGSTGPDYIGGTSDDIAGSLWSINPNTYVIEEQFMMNQADHPVKLQIYSERTMLAYLLGTDCYTGQVIKMAITAGSLNNTPVINKTFYGLGINETTEDIYGGYNTGFSTNGYVFRYTNGGALIDSMEVGIAPNGFAFKN